MRDAWEVTHPLAGAVRKREAAGTVCGPAIGTPWMTVILWGYFGGKGKFRLAWGTFDNLRDI